MLSFLLKAFQGVYMFMSTSFMLKRHILEMHEFGYTSMYMPYYAGGQYHIAAVLHVAINQKRSCSYTLNGLNLPIKFKDEVDMFLSTSGKQFKVWCTI